MDTFLYALYTVVFIGLTVWSGRLAYRTRDIGTTLICAVNASMIFENGVLAAGALIGFGSTLEALSWLRFVGMVAFPPLLIVSGLTLARRSGLAWANNRALWIGTWAFTVALIAIGFVVQFRDLQLVPKELNGVVRYMSAGKMPPPLPIIIMSVALVGFGFAIWRRTHNVWLLLGSAFVFVGDALAAGKYAIGSGVETLFMVAIVLAEYWLVQHAGQVASQGEAQHAFTGR